MVTKLRYNKALKEQLSLDYFVVEKIPISQEDLEAKDPKKYKYIEKYQALTPKKLSAPKPISKLLDPNDL